MSHDLREQLQRSLGAQYTLGAELGGGGMSRVFVADDNALRRKVVVKVLPAELLHGVSVERFNREILLAAALQHPHIVPVLSAGETDGQPYYTMPLVEGESLRVRLARSGALSLGETIGFLRDVAKALAYAHERGVVHRDIKPDNVLITGGSATVTDFGIAKAITASRASDRGDTLTQVGTSIGTPTYMSPEQAAGDPSTDHRADLYSFGCLAYELLAGRPPFTETAPRKLLAAHMGETAPPIATLRPDTPPALASLVARCLEKDPDARPQSAAQVVSILESVTSGSGSAMPTVLLGGAAMFRRALLAYAGAFVVVAILAKAAIVGIGLPDWVFPGALIVMALGLPVMLWTGYVQRVARKAATATPTYTPGGTASVPHGTMATLAMKASPHATWRRTARGGVFALGAFAAIVVAFMVMRAFGIGPAGSLLASGKLGQADQIILTDFKITNADSALSRVASDAVRQGLAESSVLKLVPPDAIVAALQRAQRPASTVVDLQTARDIALRKGVKAIVDGEVAAVAGGYLITLRLVSADSLTPLALVSASGQGSDGFIKAVDKVTRDLRAKAGESLRRVQRTPPLGDVTTGSLEALRLYSQAYRANSFEGNSLKAVSLARDAVRADSTFAMAWRLMGISAANAGLPVAITDSAYTKALEFKDRLSERERVFITATANRQGSRRDRVKSIAGWERLMAIGTATDTNIASNYLGTEYASRREFGRAESTFAIGIRADSEYTFQYTNRIIAIANRGRIAEARRAADLAVQRFPSLVTGRIRSGDLLYSEGRVDALRALTDSADASSAPGALRSWSNFRRADLAAREGRLADARRFRQRAITIDSLRGVPRDPVAERVDLASLDVVAGAPRVAQQLDSLAPSAEPRGDVTTLGLARAFAMAGRPDRARALLKSFDQRADTARRRLNEPDRELAVAEALLAEHKYSEAVVAFRRADMSVDGPATDCTICLPFNLARAFDAANQVDSSIVMYETYLTTPYFRRIDAGYDGPSLGFAHRRLGELYAIRGDNAKAAEHYRAFIELWKNADAPLQPQVADARERLRRLPSEPRRP